MKIFIGMETSGALRTRFAALGHDVISCDVLPAVHAPVTIGRHIQGDVLGTLNTLRLMGWWPDMAIFHPTCTHLTISAAWAFKDADYIRYPGVGYHQRVQPGTLVGAERREARRLQIIEVDKLWRLPIGKIIIENPLGFLSSMWRKHSIIVQPYECGDDASKKTCFWIHGLPLPVIDPSLRKAGRWVNGKERWSNQTDEGQNNIGPHDERWKDRSITFPRVADMLVRNYS